jgi:translocating chain-associated membrane protein 1
MGTGIKRRPGTKALPYLSHEFVIQNHGDIATCVCMVFVIGLMFQVELLLFLILKNIKFYFIYKIKATTPLASSFITPRYNITELSQTNVLYTYGLTDICLVFFYTITAIIFHAIIQEYILDV